MLCALSNCECKAYFGNDKPDTPFSGDFDVDGPQSDLTIHLGRFFVYEVMTCRVQLFSRAVGSQVETIKPYCGCVSTKLSDPVIENGRTTRELLLGVKSPKAGPFRSKVDVVKADGSVVAIVVKGEVTPLFEFEPKVIDFSESNDPKSINLRCLDNRICVDNATISTNDDRFLITSPECSSSLISFNLSLSSASVHLWSQYEVALMVAVEDKRMFLNLPIKSKSTLRLVPSTLTIDKDESKATRLYLIGSKSFLSNATENARIVVGPITKENYVTGSFVRRTAETGVVEFQVPWKDLGLESGTTLSVEIQTENEQNEKDWASGGTIKVYFAN